MSNWITVIENALQALISPLEWIMLIAVIGGGSLLIHSQ
jgi:hypothetical protein